MTATAEKKPVERHVRVLIPGDYRGDLFGIAVTVGKETAHYWIAEFAPDGPGRAFRMVKDQEDNAVDGRYHVLLATDRRFDSCECKGFHYNGGCRHLQVLRVLMSNGALDPKGEGHPLQPLTKG